MKSLICSSLVVAILVASVVLSGAQPIETSINGRPEMTPDQIRYFLIQRLLGAPQRTPNIPPPVRKRKAACHINGGLSHGCDYKDLIESVAETVYWDSFHSPGKRKRSASEELLNAVSQESYEMSNEA